MVIICPLISEPSLSQLRTAYIIKVTTGIQEIVKTNGSSPGSVTYKSL